MNGGRRGFIWRVGCLGAAVCCALAARGEFVIAERGKPADCAIVTKGTGPSLDYAASELRDFTERMTGVRLAVNPAARPARTVELELADVAEDAFSLRVDGTCLRVSGSVRGVLYGVYELLETYGGCAWFTPWCEMIPERTSFAVPDSLSFADQPAILMREPLWKHTRVGDFAARLRMSGNSFSLKEKHGDVSHRFSRRLPNCHTYRLLVPTEQYFDAHPEYFSEVKGRRVRTQNQLCLTNPDVLQIVISNVLAAIAAEPDARYFGVSQNDWDNHCTCAKCRALEEENGSPAGPVVAFANAVAEAVEKVHPDKVIETLAYNWSQPPPRKVRPRPNVMICLCTTDCDYSRPLTEPGWPGNARFVSRLREWGRLTRNIYIWNYNVNTYDSPAPYPNYRSMQANFRLFRDCGATSVYEEGEYKGWHSDFAELKAYLTAKWLWNPDIPEEKLLTTFFNGYYGAAAPFVRRYFDELQALPRDPAKRRLDYQIAAETDIVTDAFLVRAERLWRDALRAVKGDAVREYNVRMGRMSVDYALLVRDLRIYRMTEGGVSERTLKLAKRVQKAFDEAAAARRPVTVSEDTVRDADVKARIRAMAEGRLVGDGERAFVQEGAFRMSRYGSYQEFADDPAATDGRALKLFDNYHNWYTLFEFDKVAFDPGVRYRVRVRARFDKRAGATDGLPVLECGIYNPKSKTYPARRTWTVADVPSDGAYALLGDLEWTPAAGDFMFLTPADFEKKGDDARNPALTGVFIDGLELTRVD